MPLFDFRCRACSHVSEALVRPNSPATSCPACQSGDLERLPASFAVSSADRTRAAASTKRAKEAHTARRDTAAMDREIEAHRKDDHGH
jgi:putative FmdB family regulatory protein